MSRSSKPLVVLVAILLNGCALLPGVHQPMPRSSDNPVEEGRLVALERRVRELEAQVAAGRPHRGRVDDPASNVRTYEEFIALLEAEVAKGTVAVDRQGEQWIVNLSDELLFESGQARLKPAGIDILKVLGDVLQAVPNRRVTVAGHTDNQPIRGQLIKQFRTNLELSRARALHARRALEAGGVPPERLEAVGYAAARPIAPNATGAGRQKNRRVEIIIHPD